MDRDRLVELLLGGLLSGRLDADLTVPALRRLWKSEVEADPTSGLELLHEMEAQLASAPEGGGAELEELQIFLRREVEEEALRAHSAPDEEAVEDASRWWLGRLATAPRDWRSDAELELLPEALDLLGDRYFVASRQPAEEASGSAGSLEIADRLDSDLGSLARRIAELIDREGFEIPAPSPRDPRQAATVKWLAEARGLELHRRRRETERLLGSEAGPDAELPSRLPDGLDEARALELVEERLAEALGGDEREDVQQETARYVDLLATWPNPRMAEVVERAELDETSKHRLCVAWLVRFGGEGGSDWEAWLGWLRRQAELDENRRRWLQGLLEERGDEILLLWKAGRDETPKLDPLLVEWWREEIRSVDVYTFLERHDTELDAEEWRILQRGERSPAPKPSQPVGPTGERPFPEEFPEEIAPEEIPEEIAPEEIPAETTADDTSEPSPTAQPYEPGMAGVGTTAVASASLWERHVRPFFSEYWYLVAGVLMTVVGASTVAFYTWDEHWILRYTIMPALLALFTLGLGSAGSWIESREERLQGTAAILRGAAIALLPINFMVVILVATDPSARPAWLAATLLSALYLVVFGWALRSWCAAVHPSFRTLLALPILVVNGLIVVVGLLLALRPGESPSASPGDGDVLLLRWVLALGMYLAFAATARAVVTFARRVLTPETAAEKRVPWFLGITSTLTFLEVFLWLYGVTGILPHVATYGPLVILAGWLILVVEGRSFELRGTAQRHDAESFLGFAWILIGLLMCFAQPHVRILGFFLAGTAWLHQNRRRPLALHDGLGLTLLALGVAAVGLVEGFSHAALPALGLVVWGGLHLLPRALPRLAETARPMRMAVLLLVAVVAPLVQWHERHPPLFTAAYLLLAAALFLRRGLEDSEVRWIHTAMAILALALPYLGFVDVSGRRLHGNTLVFGLGLAALAWLGVIAALRSPRLLVAARSTVVLLYASLGAAAMVLRMVIEDGAISAVGFGSPAELHGLMHLLGPWLLVAALAITTYQSRSLVPAFLGALVGAVLYPPVFASAGLPLPWGPGVGHASVALALALLCLVLRRAPLLCDLSGDVREGDLYMGETPFPLRRHDPSLFVLPLTTVAVFLAAKVETWTLVTHWQTGSGGPAALGTAVCIVALAWLTLTILHRRRPAAHLSLALSWVSLFGGGGLLLSRLGADDPWIYALLATGLYLEALRRLFGGGAGAPPERLFPKALFPRALFPDPLASPDLRRHLDQVLSFGTLASAMGVVAALLFTGFWSPALLLLSVFLLVELCHWALLEGRGEYGVAFFFLAWVLVVDRFTPGSGGILERVTGDQSLFGVASFWPALWFLLGVQVVLLLFELRPFLYRVTRPLARPALYLSAGATAVLTLTGLLDLLAGPEIPWPTHLLLLATALVASRALAAAPLFLAYSLLVYLLVQFDALEAAYGPAAVFGWILEPWRLGLFAFGLGALLFTGTELRRRGVVLAGRWAPGGASGTGLSSPLWLSVPVVSSAMLAALYQLVASGTRESVPQLAATYLGAAAVGWVVASRLRRGLDAYLAGGLAVALTAAANLNVVRFFLRQPLLEAGLSEIHLLSLGLAVTLALLWVFRHLASGPVVRFVHRSTLVLAAGILALLSADYLLRPDLQEVTTLRLLISGAMALLAGLFFRRAARRPVEDEAEHAPLAEACYHFGVTIALWCTALLVPWMRHPDRALVALALPVFYFWLRAELGPRTADAWIRYRRSAAALAFALLGLYVFRWAFQLLLFPELAIDTSHYHQNSFLVMLLGVAMLRLRGLGGTDWLAFYGGLGLAFGSYFALTFLPGLSPFEHPVEGAWCAVALGHFWTLVATRRSPLRRAVQDLAALDPRDWLGLRRWWGLSILVASQAAVLWVCGLILVRSGIEGGASAALDPHALAPLLLGGATLLLHHGWIRGSALYYAFAGLEILAALHADFVLPSYLPAEHVAWVLLGIWGAFLVAGTWLARRREADAPALTPSAIGAVAVISAVLGMAHVVFFHHPGSPRGLALVATGALLAALTPRDQSRAGSAGERVAVISLVLVPSWLAFFGQLGTGPYEPWRPVLGLASALLLSGVVGRHYQVLSRLRTSRFAEASRHPESPRLFHQVLSWLAASGRGFLISTLLATLALVGGIQLLHYGSRWSLPELFVLVSLHAGAAGSWFWLGRDMDLEDPPQLAQADNGGRPFLGVLGALPAVLVQVHVVLFFVAVRRQLFLDGLWSYEYDVWTSLALSVVLAGAKDLIDRRPAAVRYPLLVSLFSLPVLALIWVLVHGLGTDVALVVIGLHSVLFAYMGRRSRHSGFNLLAIVGFVAFVVLTFWSRLELRILQAYVLPVGVAILALLHLFEEKIDDATRQRVRFATLLAMLASTAYYAVVDQSYPVAYHAIFLLVCLVSMGLGSFFRIRVYLALGFAGLLVDVTSIAYQTMVGLDRSLRMTTLGALVLGVGVALVAGAVFYKTHEEEIGARLERWRNRFARWE